MAVYMVKTQSGQMVAVIAATAYDAWHLVEEAIYWHPQVWDWGTVVEVSSVPLVVQEPEDVKGVKIVNCKELGI